MYAPLRDWQWLVKGWNSGFRLCLNEEADNRTIKPTVPLWQRLGEKSFYPAAITIVQTEMQQPHTFSCRIVPTWPQTTYCSTVSYSKTQYCGHCLVKISDHFGSTVWQVEMYSLHSNSQQFTVIRAFQQTETASDCPMCEITYLVCSTSVWVSFDKTRFEPVCVVSAGMKKKYQAALRGIRFWDSYCIGRFVCLCSLFGLEEHLPLSWNLIHLLSYN